MPRIEIKGQQFEVGDEFFKASPEKQNSIVQEIAKQAGIAPEPSGPADFMRSIPRGLARGATSMGRMLAGAVDPEGVSSMPPEQQKETLQTAQERRGIIDKKFEGAISGLPQPAGAAGRFGETMGEFLGDPLSYLGPGGMAAKLATTATGAIGSRVAGELTGDNPAAEIAGGVLGGGAHSLSGRPLPAARQQLIEPLERARIPMTAGQARGSRAVRYGEGHLGEMPFAGGATERANISSQEAFNEWAFQQAGINANKANMANIDAMWDNLYTQYDGITSRNRLQFNLNDLNRLHSAWQDYEMLVPPGERAPGVERGIRDMVNLAVRNGGVVSGEVYQAMRSRFARLARAAAADPERAEALREIGRTLDDGMERTLARQHSPDLGRFRTLRQQYRNATAIERAVGVGEKAEDIPPGRLRQALLAQNRREYRRGLRDMGEVTNAAEQVLAPLPQSGTGPRTAIQGMMTGIGGAIGGAAGGVPGGLAGAVGAAAMPGLAGRALHSYPVQQYLKGRAALPITHGGTRALAPSALGAFGQEDEPLVAPPDAEGTKPQSSLPGQVISDASPDPIRPGQQYAMADEPPPPTGGRKPLADPIRPRPLVAKQGRAAAPQHPKGYFDLPSDKGPTRPAVRLGKEIYEGQHTHEDALNEMTMHAPDADLRAYKMERGSVTPSGRFIPSEEP